MRVLILILVILFLFIISWLVIWLFFVPNPEIKELGSLKSDFGIYEVCSYIEDCDIEGGIEKIKQAGIKSVIITVTDEEDNKSWAYYKSQYLPMADYASEDYLEQVISLAHKNNIKVYALINLPHNYWLERHPDWIAVWSDGKPADFYEQDYFHRTVPPSRIISEPEYRDLLKNIIDEVESYGVDGIDINDNFQFSDQYLEQTDEILFSSFDEFTIKKFKKSGSDDWFQWRANQVTELITFLNQIIDIEFRPHLLFHGDPYEYYGLDYDAIAKQVDALYLMIMSDQPQEKYRQAKGAVVSTYLFGQEQEILKRIKWIRQAGAKEIYFYNFKLMEQNNLWHIVN